MSYWHNDSDLSKSSTNLIRDPRTLHKLGVHVSTENGVGLRSTSLFTCALPPKIIYAKFEEAMPKVDQMSKYIYQKEDIYYSKSYISVSSKLSSAQ